MVCYTDRYSDRETLDIHLSSSLQSGERELDLRNFDFGEVIEFEFHELKRVDEWW